jgi:anti-anti-sigma factor
MAEVLQSGSLSSDPVPIAASSEQVPILLTESWKATPSPHRASIVVGRYRGTVVVTVHGELDKTKAVTLGTTLADLIDGQGNLFVVIDLQYATAADEDCLWVFTQAIELARRRGGQIKLSGPSPSMQSALQLRGLDAFVGKFLKEGR